MTIHQQNTSIPTGQIQSGLCPLPQWGLILVEGPDAASFLHNQLTNAVLGLERTYPPQLAQGHLAVRLVGYCSPKGRLMASSWMGLYPANESADDRFALFISKDIAGAFAKRLSMFVLRSKVKVVDASNQWMVNGQYGVEGQITPATDDPESFTLRLPDVLIAGQSVSRFLQASPNNLSEGLVNSNDALKTWNYLEVISAIPRIVLATQEQFVPQMINFESVEGVDFKKGCYPGQEIVARSQYRGVIKRRLQLAHLMNESAEVGPDFCQPGLEVFHSNDPAQPAGMVVLSAANPFVSNRIELQIECKLEALESGKLHLGSTDGPELIIDLLPYPLIEI
jgi:tRNA-modifying protein YgfZ